MNKPYIIHGDREGDLGSTSSPYRREGLVLCNEDIFDLDCDDKGISPY